MANHPSAEKRNRQNAKRRARNTKIRSRTRTEERKLQESLESKDSGAIQKSLRSAVAEVMLAKSKGVYPANRAARKVARMSRAAHRATTKKSS